MSIKANVDVVESYLNNFLQEVTDNVEEGE